MYASMSYYYCYYAGSDVGKGNDNLDPGVEISVERIRTDETR